MTSATFAEAAQQILCEKESLKKEEAELFVDEMLPFGMERKRLQPRVISSFTAC